MLQIKNPQERRRHQRMSLLLKMNCIRLDPDGQDVVDVLETTDISRSGLGAICSRSFYPGQRMVLCMPLSSMGGKRNVYATVVRCRQGEEGYRVGVEFDAASVGAWGGSSTAVSGWDIRSDAKPAKAAA